MNNRRRISLVDFKVQPGKCAHTIDVFGFIVLRMEILMSTLKEMATSLNLSVMAVSKALRDAPDISVSTKARVQAEARRRNYIPNRAAQNLRSRKSGLIGVVVPQINHTIYSHLVW